MKISQHISDQIKVWNKCCESRQAVSLQIEGQIKWCLFSWIYDWDFKFKIKVWRARNQIKIVDCRFNIYDRRLKIYDRELEI